MSYYAVKTGRNPGVFYDWSSCEEQADRYSHARYKKFGTRAEALDFVNNRKASDHAFDDGLEDSYQTSSRSSYSTGSGVQSSYSNITPSRKAGSSGSKSKGGTSYSRNQSFGESTSYEDSWDGSQGYDCRSKAASSAHSHRRRNQESSGYRDCGFTGTPFSDHEGHKVYTDGASTNNGYSSASAGIGVYWGPNDPHNTSERLRGRQTNNRAEIQAAERAVHQAKERGIQNLVLHTDSEFLINGATKWTNKWKQNGWKLSTGGDVVNREDFEKLDQAMTGMNINWKHVSGHRGIEGNEAADRLANAGAAKPL